MCRHYYFDYPTCHHVSTEYYAPCATVTQHGGEPCDLPSDSQPERVVCDEPCPECLGSGPSPSHNGREGLSTTSEGGEWEYGSRTHTARPTAGARSVASELRRNRVGDDRQPEQRAPGAPRWPLQDSIYEYGLTDDNLHSVRSSRSDNTLRQKNASPNSPDHYREAELEAAKVEAALRTSVLTADIDYDKLMEYVRQLSLHDAPPVNAHVLEQTEYAKQMRLPEDDDAFLHEAKKESIRTLTEQQLRQYELRHATRGSPSRPDSRAASSSNSRAGPSRAAQSPQAFASTPSADDYRERSHIPSPTDHFPPRHQSPPLPQQRPSEQFTSDFPTRGVMGDNQSTRSSRASSYDHDDEPGRADHKAHR